MPDFRKLLTKEGENLPAIPHSEYPRPQLVRDSYFCLNGEWDFAVTRGDAPENYNMLTVACT